MIVACLPCNDSISSSSSVVWNVVIFMLLSTLEIRISFISVLWFIASILINNATINNNDKKEKSQELLGPKSPHLAEDLLWDSMLKVNAVIRIVVFYIRFQLSLFICQKDTLVSEYSYR